MKQVNFRIDEDEYSIIKQLAEQLHVSIPELSKMLIFEKTSDLRLNAAVELYRKGTIGLKRAWKLSGLSPYAFRQVLIARNVEPPDNEALEEKALENALSIKMKDFLKK